MHSGCLDTHCSFSFAFLTSQPDRRSLCMFVTDGRYIQFLRLDRLSAEIDVRPILMYDIGAYIALSDARCEMMWGR